MTRCRRLVPLPFLVAAALIAATLGLALWPLAAQTAKVLLADEVPALCKTLSDKTNLTATDDIPDLWIFAKATTVLSVKGISSGGTSLTVTIEDDAGNDLTTSCVLATTLTNCTLTSNVTFTADERADWTTVSVSGSVTDATVCLYVEVD